MTFNIRPSVYYVAAPVEPKPEEPNPLCPKCFKPIFQGKSHKCPSKYKTKRFKNVVENISPEGLKKLQVYVNDKVGGYVAVEKVKISLETLEKMMVQLKMSQREIIELTRILKEDVAVTFEAYLPRKLSMKCHSLDDFFGVKEFLLYLMTMF